MGRNLNKYINKYLKNIYINSNFIMLTASQRMPAPHHKSEQPTSLNRL